MLRRRATFKGAAQLRARILVASRRCLILPSLAAHAGFEDCAFMGERIRNLCSCLKHDINGALNTYFVTFVRLQQFPGQGTSLPECGADWVKRQTILMRREFLSKTPSSPEASDTTKRGVHYDT